VHAGAQTCARSCYDVYTGREARPAALRRARRRAATERAKSDTKLIAQGCNTSALVYLHFYIYNIYYCVAQSGLHASSRGLKIYIYLCI